MISELSPSRLREVTTLVELTNDMSIECLHSIRRGQLNE